MQMPVHPMSVTFPDSPLPDVPIVAELRFDPSLPYAACLAFPLTPCECVPDETLVCWYFSRELLNEGRHAPAGNGDVQVSPGHRGEVLITLRGPDGEQAVLSAPEGEVAAFLSDSFQLVPAGSESEHLDVDATLALLFADD
ncbi:SsgA family sporulation/cell division regulator [Kitasatospora brasiliensis]|uniref:SsgA family sporulation/cell division regulator n=1 Tax=Kitasatospora brasiliensis TaxID=3058040 RepID=UPI00292D96A6|nr:SsgA family sporulation/cell division regulator [Kitasatospora sp. K002]